MRDGVTNASLDDSVIVVMGTSRALVCLLVLRYR